jgi:GAF domain
MARLGVTKKKKSPRTTELSQLKKEVQRLTEQLESRDREQTATSEILRLIATFSTNNQSVLDTIAENAARVCDSYDAVIRLIEGNILRLAAHYGAVEPHFGLEQSFTRGSPPGRAVIDRQAIHVHDLAADAETEFPESKTRQPFDSGTRTILVTPLLREGVPIGTISIRRTEVRPFTDKQIALIQDFRQPGRNRHRERTAVPGAGSADARVGAVGRGIESVGGSRSGGQLNPRPPDRASHHCASCDPALTNRWWCRLRVRRGCGRVPS